jgi:hypothetical protein
MFCPTCRDEFRAGFTRCARCEVDLIDDLSQLDAEQSRTKAPPPQAPMVMADYCGFFSLQEATQARERLRQERIISEIVLREPPDPDWDAPPQDEFWLRVDVSRAGEVQKLMAEAEGKTPPKPPETFACGECGHAVAEADEACPGCGARFDED